MNAAPSLASAPCLIVNPLSFRASTGLAAQAMALAAAQGAEVVSIDSPSALTAAVDAILARRQRHVMVLGGDGTVRAVVEQLAKLAPDAWRPELLVLAGGRTNLTAADLVPGGRALVTLKRALQLSGAGWDAAVVERFTLCVEQSPAPPRHGLFVGAALVDSVIRRTHAYRAAESGALRTGHFGTAWSMLRLAALALAGRAALTCPELHVDAGAAGQVQGRVRLLLATTLWHRTGLFNPYAARGEPGGLRVTAVTRRAPRFWRALPRLVTGRYTAAMTADNGYLSGACERIQITGLSGYTLDGEEFETDPARPVVITRGPRLRFVSP